MSTFLLDHFGPCEPLKSCPSCEAAVFLRSKLSISDYATLVWMANNAKAATFAKATESLFESSVDILDLDIRTKNVLRNAHIVTIRALVNHTRKELLSVPDLGRRSLADIETALDQIHLALKPDD